ncbi:MAG: PEP-utilizing enzyme [Patescibacteria group bacterium]|jgi:phosphohistidine swiveling domain-containing protein
MSLERTLKETKKHTYWSEEAPAVPMFSIWVRAFVEQSKFWHPTLPNFMVAFFKSDFVFEETPEDQKLAIWHYLWKKYQRGSTLQRKNYELWREVRRGINREGDFFIKSRNGLSDQEVIKSMDRFNRLVLDHWRITWVLESADVFTTYELPKLLSRELPQLTPAEVTNIMATLSQPLKLSFLEEYQCEVLEVAVRWYGVVRRFSSLSKSPTALQKTVNLLSKKYFWLNSNYKKSNLLIPSILYKEVRRQCEENSQKKLKVELYNLLSKIKRLRLAQFRLRKQFRLSYELKTAFKLLSFWMSWIDERKHLALIANLYFEVYANELERRSKLNIWEIKYLSIEERHQLLRGGKIPNKRELALRRKFSAFVQTKRNGINYEHIYTGSSAKKIWSVIFINQASKKEIKGQVVASPVKKIQGRVQVVLEVSKSKFRKGSILVTTMTRPEFMPLVRQARAIITDEGGITCHAAIIARELNIPCIIGTKVATKVLKNGDFVEIDSDQGLVRKL